MYAVLLYACIWQSALLYTEQGALFFVFIGPFLERQQGDTNSHWPKVGALCVILEKTIHGISCVEVQRAITYLRTESITYLVHVEHTFDFLGRCAVKLLFQIVAKHQATIATCA